MRFHRVGMAFFSMLLGLGVAASASSTELPNCEDLFSKEKRTTKGLTISCNAGGPPQLAYLIDPKDPKGDPKLCGCNADWVKCNPYLNNPDTNPEPQTSAADSSSKKKWSLPPCVEGAGGLKAIPSAFEYINDGTTACTTIGGTRVCFRAR
jgi:hypothetical protein